MRPRSGGCRDGEARDSVRMVERHPVGAASAPVVSHDGELVVAERAHGLDLVTRDAAHAVRTVVRG